MSKMFQVLHSSDCPKNRGKWVSFGREKTIGKQLGKSSGGTKTQNGKLENESKKAIKYIVVNE